MVAGVGKAFGMVHAGDPAGRNILTVSKTSLFSLTLCCKAVPKTIEDRIKRNLQFAEWQKLNDDLLQEKTFALSENPIPKCIESISPTAMLDSTAMTVQGMETAIASCIGRRKEMEDAHLAQDFFIFVEGDCHFGTVFGIFDGHGGKGASLFVKDNLLAYLTESLEEHNVDRLTNDGIWKALREACIRLDRDYSSNEEGTTATIAMILNGQIWVANVGDSRTILVDKRKIVQLTEDAKPDLPRYIKKIHQLGGHVTCRSKVSRVNGNIAMARAIGDKYVRGFEGKCCLSPIPKITRTSLENIENGFLVLACDGLYDVATSNEVGNHVQTMRSRGDSLQNMAARLVLSAIENGSKDNVSVLIVKLSNK